ncbi:Staphylococcal accessory regulator Z [Aerococcus viridans]|uniref:MarR family transcriptional regulator n=2 Tax=Aerococcus viridans TaxID=1377 RepID=A0AAU8U6H8_9LACT|nr:MarR family transcriptional regulator [Aerococcus viridans]AMC01053.1 MarR family transcriptional regulator [Aerococcus viridans]EFG48739.1 transcriptional regulator, MarR family [Aerococcus viridans ATCC 11563 = CCUG 4311]MCT1798059.1 MarR family transcriptional regulator [Aerococcus viridans]SUU03837.1 Staphylococcal accessory regulator Z [Aerococcus viridans]
MNANDNPLQNELCFQLYVASKESIRMYKPFLDEVDLTYTGFITLMAIEDNLSVKQIGERLFLDSGTLSPLLKKMEKQGLLHRIRASTDERQLVIQLTEKGKSLQEKLPCISRDVYQSITKSSESGVYGNLISQLIQLNQSFREV